MLVRRDICHSGERRSIESVFSKIKRKSRKALIAPNRQHCDWSASSWCKIFTREKYASAQPKPSRRRARSKLGECKRRLHTKAGEASRRYREAYNRARLEATTGTPEYCRTWMLNATIFRFGSSLYYFSSPAFCWCWYVERRWNERFFFLFDRLSLAST